MKESCRMALRSAQAKKEICFFIHFFLVVVLWCHATFSAQGAMPMAAPSQTEGLQASQTAATTGGAIAGRVADEDGRPIAFARVSAIPAGVTGTSSGTRTVFAGSDGRFLINNLEPRAYRVTASAPAYVSSDASSDPPGNLDYHHTGESVSITLAKGGVITGSVTDSSGDPVVAASVSAIRVRDDQGYLLPIARLSLVTGKTYTDDHGVYRIYGLPAGTYVVVSGGSAPPFFPALALAGRGMTYYPSETRDMAAEIKLQAGEEVSGIDIHYRGETGHSISGRVVAAVQPVATEKYAQVWLRSTATGWLENGVSTSDIAHGGSFAIYGVRDGQYEIIAELKEGDETLFRSAGRTITVAGSDVSGVEMRLDPLASLAGKVVLEPRNGAPCTGSRDAILREIVLSCRREDGNTKAAAQPPVFSDQVVSSLDEQGAFTLSGLEGGRYWLDVQLPSDEWYLSSMTLTEKGLRAGKAAASQNGFVAKQGERKEGLTVTIGQGAASLSGRLASVSSAEGVVSATRVFLVPAETAQPENVFRYREARPGPDGSFLFRNLAPGSYWILSDASFKDDLTLRDLAVTRSTALRSRLVQIAKKMNAPSVELKPCTHAQDYVPSVVLRGSR